MKLIDVKCYEIMSSFIDELKIVRLVFSTEDRVSGNVVDVLRLNGLMICARWLIGVDASSRR